MGMNSGYWFHKNKLYDVENNKHINLIISYPEKFNLTKEDILNTYEKHGEKLGVEGKAREELIIHALSNGWIRVRHYTRPKDYWSIQYDDFRKQEKELHNLVETLILDKGDMNMNDELVLLGFSDESQYHYPWSEKGAKKFLSESRKIERDRILEVTDFEEM